MLFVLFTGWMMGLQSAWRSTQIPRPHICFLNGHCLVMTLAVRMGRVGLGSCRSQGRWLVGLAAMAVVGVVPASVVTGYA